MPDGTVYSNHGERIPHIDWVICGGESGQGARPMHPDWARSLRDQCAAAGAPFLFKQWGEHIWCEQDQNVHPNLPAQPIIGFKKVGKKKAGRLLDGVEHNDFPSVHASPSVPIPERSVTL
jgi:protein gp37